jgi:hypothetical protein
MDNKRIIKRGRKPLPENQKKKSIWAVFPPEIITLLNKDVEDGKSDTINQRITQIVKKYYTRKLKK